MVNDNDSGAAPIIGFIFMFLACGIMFLMIGAGIDRLSTVVNTMFVGIPMGQIVFDVFNLQMMVLRLEPFIILIAGGIHFWIERTSQISRDVDVGGTIYAGAEMILVTGLMTIFGIAGGYALSTVVQIVNNLIYTPLPDHNTIIMYLPMAFSAIIFLLTIAAVVMFVSKMFKVVDYSSGYPSG